MGDEQFGVALRMAPFMKKGIPRVPGSGLQPVVGFVPRPDKRLMGNPMRFTPGGNLRSLGAGFGPKTVIHRQRGESSPGFRCPVMRQ